MLKVNRKAYDWGDVDLQLPGLALEVQEISYDDEQEKELVYGRGNKPEGTEEVIISHRKNIHAAG